MSSILPPDATLYEFALRTDPSAPALTLSPATFKSVVSSLVDLLVEHKIAAIVWTKLPRGDIWQAELDRYSLLPDIAKTLYVFRNQREEEVDESSLAGPGLVSPVDGSDRVPSPTFPPTGIIPINLPPENALRREYFLLVWSAQFQGGVAAHRSRVHAAKATGNGTGIHETGPGEPGSDDVQDKKQQLLTLCLFDGQHVEQLLQGIEQAIAPEPIPPESSPATPALDPIAQWKQQIANITPAASNTTLLEQLFMQQLHKQDEIWSRSTLYRKQAETVETLQIQNEELSNTVRLKDDFLSNVGQELRTPLTTIKTALTLLNSPNLKSSQRQRYMELIAKECDRQSSLITSLLDLVQLDRMAEKTVIEPLRVSDVVPGVVSTYQPLAEEKGVMLAYTVPEDLAPVSCASSWLKQIVINLLHNGIKFTPRGGQVWVRAKQQGDFIQIEFRDTGIGIAPSEIPKIFDRFYRVRQTAEDASGAGLGLTIVQQLLLHCGGSISVRSRLGEGSTFAVLLPIYRSMEV